MTTKQEIGFLGECLAQQFLVGQGYRIVATNVRMQRGELDIVARDDREVVFAEVKTRTNDLYGLPEEGMTWKKQLHFLKAVQEFSLRHRLFDIPQRHLVISLVLDRAGCVRRFSTLSPFSS